MSPEERLAHDRRLNRAACQRRSDRKKAALLGLPGPPLLATPAANDEERAARHSERERRRRCEMGESYRAAERVRNAKPTRMASRRQTGRANYLANKVEYIAKVLRWRAANPAKVSGYAATSYTKLRADPIRSAKRRVTRKAYEVRRLQREPAFRMLKRLRVAFAQALRLYGNGRKTASVRVIVGCTMQELVAHLESQWEPWMRWGNHGLIAFKKTGTAWVVDHIRPCSSFDMSDPIEQAQCFHWSNLQPLEYLANIRKGGQRRPRLRNEDSIDP